MKLGENIYRYAAARNGHVSGTFPVDRWYKEIEQFDWADNEAVILGKYSKICHFTQIVWKDTKYSFEGVMVS